MSVALALPALLLSQSEQDLLGRLTAGMLTETTFLQLPNRYYLGEQIVADLGIAIPPQLRGLRTVLGWPGVAVDALEERLDVEGFRLQAQIGADDDLWAIWQANNLDEEAPLAHLDALVYGRSFVAVGSPPDPGDPPLITVESPLNTSIIWDPQRRQAQAALMYTGAFTPDRTVELGFINSATATTALLFTPDQTISLARESGGMWAILDRDVHLLGRVPVVRLANRQRTGDRAGRSEITPAIMSITDAACRTLLGLEVAREFYAAPQRYILGASESAFQDSSGNPKAAWETYLGRILALERDEDGNVPTVGSFATGDPSAYTQIVDMYAKVMASLSGLPSHYLGYTTENPASADAIRSSEARLVKRAERKQQAFSGSWEQVMRLAMLVRDGSVGPAADRLETLWADASTPTLAATTDAIVKQVQAGIIPGSSDVTRARLGYTPAERAQIEADLKREDASGVLASLGQMASARVLASQETAGSNALPTDTTTGVVVPVAAAVGHAPAARVVAAAVPPAR